MINPNYINVHVIYTSVIGYVIDSWLQWIASFICMCLKWPLQVQQLWRKTHPDSSEMSEQDELEDSTDTPVDQLKCPAKSEQKRKIQSNPPK